LTQFVDPEDEAKQQRCGDQDEMNQRDGQGDQGTYQSDCEYECGSSDAVDKREVTDFDRGASWMGSEAPKRQLQSTNFHQHSR
jgi:hypothetical protein